MFLLFYLLYIILYLRKLFCFLNITFELLSLYLSHVTAPTEVAFTLN